MHRHNAHRDDPSLAFLLSRRGPPGLPTRIGILRQGEHPTLELRVNEQMAELVTRRSSGNLTSLLQAADTWEVK